MYRAINKQSETLDVYFSPKRNKEAAYQFIRRCIRYYSINNQPKTLNTDKHSSYTNAIARLKKEGRLRKNVEQRQVNISIVVSSLITPLSRNSLSPLVGLKYEDMNGQRFRDSGIQIITDVEQRAV